MAYVNRIRNRAGVDAFDQHIPLLVDDAAKITENGTEHRVNKFDLWIVEGE